MLSGDPNTQQVIIEHQGIVPGVVHLDKLIPVEAKVAEAFFKNRFNKPDFIDFEYAPKVSFIRNGREDCQTIRFSRQLYRFISKKKPNAIKYAVQEREPFDKGNFGEVYMVTRTLKLDKDGHAVCELKSPDKWRVLKIPHNNVGSVLTVKEGEVLRCLPHMHAKQFPKLLSTAALLMRYAPGVSLFKCLQQHKTGVTLLSVMQRLDLSRQLFAALYDQLHKSVDDNPDIYRVIHRDIKPENIMVSFKPDGTLDKVTYIDFNLAKRIGALVAENVGTPLYASPEMFLHQCQTEKSDIYSLGRVLWFLWGLKLNIADDFVGDDERLLREHAELTQLPFLFSDVAVSDLSADHRKQIHDFLLSINSVNQDERPDVSAAIQLFDRIIGEIQYALLAKKVTDIQQRASTLTANADMQTVGIHSDDKECVRAALPSPAIRGRSPALFQPAAALVPVAPASANRADRQCVLF